ncbi:MAG: hypothetical protein HN350_18780 [Phycisphaerales bacterium]|nr:hypothetical protein [Phycisphaerales bacterium]
MAKRITTEDSDSCELMLDTICNVFGGMILMAVLVIIQTQVTVAKLPRDEVKAADASIALRKVKSEISRQEKQTTELEEKRRNQAKKYSATISPHTDELLTSRQTFSEAIKDAKRRIAEDTKKHQADQENIKDVHAQQGRAEKTLEERRDKLAIVRREQMRLDQISRKKIRLPITHQSRAPKQQILVVHGKNLYFCPQHCTVQSRSNGGSKITPDADDGLAVIKKGQVTGLDAVLSGISTRTHFLSLFVSDHADSFESFQYVREILVAKGFECGYDPYDASIGLTLYSGNPGVE